MLTSWSPWCTGGAACTPETSLCWGQEGSILLAHVQSGRDVSVPESWGLSWSSSARTVSLVPSYLGCHPRPWSCHHTST